MLNARAAVVLNQLILSDQLGMSANFSTATTTRFRSNACFLCIRMRGSLLRNAVPRYITIEITMRGGETVREKNCSVKPIAHLANDYHNVISIRV